MDDTLISAIVNWLPVVVFVAAFIYLSRKSTPFSKKYDRNVEDFMKSNAELIAINKEMAQTLVDIRKLLETGKP